MQNLRQVGTEIEWGDFHPGEVLREDFFLPMDLTAYRLSKSRDLEKAAAQNRAEYEQIPAYA